MLTADLLSAYPATSHSDRSGPVLGLSLTQPWAQAMADGVKRVETRSWRPAEMPRGPVLIHAAINFPRIHWPFAEQLGYDPADLPTGAIVAIGRMVGLARTEDLIGVISEGEERLGDYHAGRWAWVFNDVVPVEPVIPCKGALGLWTPDPAVVAELVRRRLVRVDPTGVYVLAA